MCQAGSAVAADPSVRRHLVRLGLSEALGTAVLLAAGLSAVIGDLGAGSPVGRAIGPSFATRALTGFLFGAIGGSIALSWVGRTSGAHINPIVTLTFWLEGTVPTIALPFYIGGQLLGGILGSLPLFAWGAMGKSVGFGTTVPGAAGAWAAAGGEAICSAVLISALLTFVGSHRLRRYTPAIFAPMYAAMVAIEAPLSGTSTNPARSFGPAVVFDVWSGFWVYLVGPVIGALGAIALRRRLVPPLERLELDLAKLGRFEHDPFRLLEGRHRLPRPAPVTTARQADAARPGEPRDADEPPRTPPPPSPPRR